MKQEIRIKPGSKFPYQTTDVPFAQSQEEIKDLLRKFKCEEILSYEGNTDIKLAFKKEGVPYLIEFPLIYEEGRKTQSRLRMDISGRVILNRIKTQLIDVEIGSLSFMQAMLRMVALPAPQGVVTLGDLVEAQVEQIKRGQIELDPTKIRMLTEAK